MAEYGLVLVRIRPQRARGKDSRTDTGDGVLHPPAPQCGQRPGRITIGIIDRHDSRMQFSKAQRNVGECAIAAAHDEVDAIASTGSRDDGSHPSVDEELATRGR
ncbi:hypothetical protein AQJ27_17155 [Streptomyces olivochromogenes]|nr:hypothetical protein AQJ27_17155 [Streptomyces olivochromogenes]